jgi:hypothetical protein
VFVAAHRENERMDRILSILPFTAALVVALMAMPQHVYAFNQRGIGVDHALPWTQRVSTMAASASAVMRGLGDRLSRESGRMRSAKSRATYSYQCPVRSAHDSAR